MNPSTYRKVTAEDVDSRETSRGIEVISMADYAKVCDDTYYGDYRRYRLYAQIIDMLLDIPVGPFTAGKQILEVGCYKLPFVFGSQTMDIAATRTHPVVHDASLAPWPFREGQFSVCIMSHVVEHLDDPGTAIAEAARVADWLVIALPLNWRHSGTKGHDGLNQETLQRWVIASQANLVPWLVAESRTLTPYEQFVAVYQVRRHYPRPCQGHDGNAPDYDVLAPAMPSALPEEGA